MPFTLSFTVLLQDDFKLSINCELQVTTLVPCEMGDKNFTKPIVLQKKFVEIIFANAALCNL